MKLIPYSTQRPKKKRWVRYVSPSLMAVSLSVVVLVAVVFSFPSILIISIQHEQGIKAPASFAQFPVTVNPKGKSIVENDQVNALLASPDSPLHVEASAGSVSGVLGTLFQRIAIAIGNTPWYQSVAAVDTKFVTIAPGMRKEQVASAFASVLGWKAKQRTQFMTASTYATLPLPEGSFESGVYLVNSATTPIQAQLMVNDNFDKNIVSHYSDATAQVVPLDTALTIASLIERETGGPDDMRLISGIIWNRLFANMNLQLDATLQYAKAQKSPIAGSWWPQVVPKDKYINSPYNTYLHAGLPPTPIASPSVAAVLAALNPVNTPCLFYFHDRNGNFHCTDTYAAHVALLKKYYGQGK